MDSFTLKTRYSVYPDCRFVAARYHNDNLALSIVNPEGPIMTCTINPGVEVPIDCVCIKDYSENTGIAATLVNMGIIEPEPIAIIPSGFVELPVYRLTPKGAELWDMDTLSVSPRKTA